MRKKLTRDRLYLSGARGGCFRGLLITVEQKGGNAVWPDGSDYFAEGSLGVASHFIRFLSVAGPFVLSQALTASPTLFP
jgi:hypothetical protein